MKRTANALCLMLAIGAAGCATMRQDSLPRFGSAKAESTERVLSMARLLERHGKHEEARRLYLGLLEKDPKHALAYHRLGILEVRRGAHDAALEYFERAKSQGEPSAELLSDIGYTLYLKHELESAEAVLRDALEMNPYLKTAQTNLGLVLAELQRDDEALVEFQKTCSEAEAFANLAFIQTKLGRLQDAEKNYHRALDVDPKFHKAAEALIQFQSARNKADVLMAKMEQQTQAEGGDVAHGETAADVPFANAHSNNAQTETPMVPPRPYDPIATRTESVTAAVHHLETSPALPFSMVTPAAYQQTAEVNSPYTPANPPVLAAARSSAAEAPIVRDDEDQFAAPLAVPPSTERAGVVRMGR